MRIQQHAVSKCSSFYLLYELHPRIPENASEKVGERAVADTVETAVTNAAVAVADAAGTAVADTAGTAVTNAVVAVADAIVADAEPRLKEISHTRVKANELLLN
ncbi:hypothetical protein BDDG_12290 [Blastomyces dermatitidis ATCC 18188]|uniref:Uncharacterized protein n=1 Tax=Ajellomyces dermatitidis (strain ATCC 18188 / CBS 674.68) TaxID=653446 RepID=A0A0J9EN92_AJEDA|nr:hypothetical protein BDDG_12290 [Blastomyces dermatitidis ATCC 18188]